MADYSLYIDEGLPGLIYDMHNKVIRTYAVKSDIQVQFGMGVSKVYGTENIVKPITFSGEELLGIVVNDPGIANNGIAGISGTKTVSVMTFGSIYAQVETDVLSGQSVYVRTIASSGFSNGGFRKDSDNGKAIKIPNAKFIKNASAGALSVIEISGNFESPVGTSCINFDSANGIHALSASFNSILLQNLYFVSPVDVAINAANNISISVKINNTELSTLSTAKTALKAGQIVKLPLNVTAIPPNTALIANVAQVGTGALKGQFFLEYKVI